MTNVSRQKIHLNCVLCSIKVTHCFTAVSLVMVVYGGEKCDTPQCCSWELAVHYLNQNQSHLSVMKLFAKTIRAL